MSWIKTIDYTNARGVLRRLYDRCKGPEDAVDHVLTVHSLRPHTLQGHLALYKSVLHHQSNTLDKWYLEALGTYVSRLNACTYCEQHHRVGVEKNLPQDLHLNTIMTGIESERFEEVFSKQYTQGFIYARRLTRELHHMVKADVEAMKAVGFNDGQILEVNQVVSYFNYVNRVVLGLGVNIEAAHIGLSPSSDDPDDWIHR
ncbi:MAG: hypothetical protein KTR24_00550 [Saprospiraceae bacterium]|nr:hypothetical protein [Saprospiraceae bacterium]